MSTLFKSAEAKATIVSWYERFRAQIPHATEKRTLSTRSGEVHVLVGGPVSGRPVVVLHGALASSAHVLRELHPLLERFRVYAVDIVGQSSMSADVRLRVDDDAYGHWLAEVATALGLTEPFDLVGVSWGGFVSMRFAAVHGARIRRLALLTPAGLVNGPAWAGFRRILWPMWRYQRSPTPERLAAFVEHLLTTKGDDWTPYLGDAFLAYRLNMKVPRLAKTSEFSAFTAPTLLMGAERDLSFPGEALLARGKQLFHGPLETELIRDAAHCPPTTDTFRAWLGARVTQFLAT